MPALFEIWSFALKTFLRFLRTRDFCGGRVSKLHTTICNVCEYVVCERHEDMEIPLAPGLAFGRGGSRGAAATSKTHGFLQGISWDRPNEQTSWN